MNAAVSRADTTAAQKELGLGAAAARSAYRNTRGPVWWVGSHLPVLGDDIAAVRTVAVVSRDLTASTLPQLVKAGSTLSGTLLKPSGGKVPLAPIRRIAPSLAEGGEELEAQANQVSDIETGGLLPQIRGPVSGLKEKLVRASTVVTESAAVTRLLPDMLGERAPRTYFLVFQNNAEIKSLGGLGGAFAIVEADDGRIKLTRTSRPAEVGEFGRPVLKPSPGQLAVLGMKPFTQSQNALSDPDFPRGARVLAEMWRRSQGQQIDGVVAVDPVALAYLLRATGPVTVGGRTLTEQNAVDTLLRDVYLQVPTDQAQNAFFAELVRQLFGRLSTGKFDATQLAQALSRGVEERRVLAFSQIPREQKQLAATEIGGVLPTSDERRPEVGVYLNDAGFDKLTYYLNYRTDVTADRCYLGAQRLTVRTVLSSKVPPGPLTPFVVGPGSEGLPLGDMRITVYAYGPVDGRVDALRVDGKARPVNSMTDAGRPVGSVTVDIPRGGKHVIEYTMYSARGQSGRAHLLTTPGAKTDGVGTIGPSAC
ncbi:hypothetical protein GCM10009815_25720 [Nocardioides marmoribigeumensis]